MRIASCARLASMFLGLAGFAVAAPKPVLWKPTTTSELLRVSDAVVVGRIRDIARGAPGPDCVDRAELVVERVIHGFPIGSSATLVFPGKARGSSDSEGNLVPDQSLGLIRYDVGQEGVFFLLRRDPETWSANHPARFKPRMLLARVLEEVAEATR